MKPEIKKRSYGFYLSQIVIILLYIFPALGAAVGLFLLITGIEFMMRSPETAIGISSMAIACAVVPFCLSSSLAQIIKQITKD